MKEKEVTGRKKMTEMRQEAESRLQGSVEETKECLYQLLYALRLDLHRECTAAFVAHRDGPVPDDLLDGFWSIDAAKKPLRQSGTTDGA